MEFKCSQLWGVEYWVWDGTKAKGMKWHLPVTLPDPGAPGCQDPLECEPHEGRAFGPLCSLLDPQFLEQSLDHGECPKSTHPIKWNVNSSVKNIFVWCLMIFSG